MFVRINHSHQIRACNSWRCKHKKSCPRKYHSVSRSLLIEEKNWVKDKKFPLQATFTSPSEPQNYQVQPEITNTGRIKAGHCPFSCSQLPFNYGWFSSLRPSLPRSLLSLLHSPDPSFSFLSVLAVTAPPNTFSASVSFSICHAWNLLMELTNGRIMERPDGDPSNPSWFCICLK